MVIGIDKLRSSACNAQNKALSPDFLESNRVMSTTRDKAGMELGGPCRRFALATASLLVALLFSGCAAMTNPVAHGIPARMLPPELLAESVENRAMLPLTALRRLPPQEYHLATGDVLGIYIEGVLGEAGNLPPVYYPELSNTPPSFGYPIPVRNDGALPLPLVPPVQVAGMTVEQAQQAIIEAYTVKRQILRVDRERIIVTLIRPRQERILVVRQDGTEPTATTSTTNQSRGLGGPLRQGHRSPILGTGTGHVIELPTYESDVLSALTMTGGLPGGNAVSEIIIQRGGFPPQRRPSTEGPTPLPPLDATQTGCAGYDQFVRIPLMLRPGEPLPFQPEDVALRTGDIVFIRARENAVFYTGGLLPGGEYSLPRDYDLDIVEAVSMVGGPLVNGLFAGSNLSGGLVERGIGSPSPKLLSVIRRMPDGRQVLIRVDLHQALRDPRENILIKAGDILVLQEEPKQALVRYFNDTFNFFWVTDVIESPDSLGQAIFNLP